MQRIAREESSSHAAFIISLGMYRRRLGTRPKWRQKARQNNATPPLFLLSQLINSQPPPSILYIKSSTYVRSFVCVFVNVRVPWPERTIDHWPALVSASADLVLSHHWSSDILPWIWGKLDSIICIRMQGVLFVDIVICTPPAALRPAPVTRAPPASASLPVTHEFYPTRLRLDALHPALAPQHKHGARARRRGDAIIRRCLLVSALTLSRGRGGARVWMVDGGLRASCSILARYPVSENPCDSFAILSADSIA